MRKLLIILLSICCFSLTGCYTVLSKIRIVDVQQGNIYTPDMLKQLHTGMSKDQVRNIFGDPLLTTTFDQQRWDYAYTMQKARHGRAQQHLTIYFTANNTVAKWVTK